MVKFDDKLSSTFFALSDATRRQILVRLRRGEQSVSQVAEPFDVSLAAVSKHLNVLEQAKLIRRKKSGRRVLVRLSTQRLKQAESWLVDWRQFWDQSLDRLEDSLKRKAKQS